MKEDLVFPKIETEETISRWDNSVYGHVFSKGGLTQRELFAAMAMQHLIGQVSNLTELAKQSVMHADALIEELEKQ